MDERRFFVYAYYRCQEDFPERPFYIGKGRGFRDRDHLSDKRNNPKTRCIRKHRDTLVVRRLREGLTEAQAFHVEKVLIAYFRPMLYNATDGGEGFCGGKHRQEWKDMLSERNRQRVLEGTHHFLGGAIQHARVEAGTHNFLNGSYAKMRASARRDAEETVEFVNHLTGETFSGTASELANARGFDVRRIRHLAYGGRTKPFYGWARADVQVERIKYVHRARRPSRAGVNAPS